MARPGADFDGLFKSLFIAIFHFFFRLFYRDWLVYVDITRIDRQDKELLTFISLPDGSRRYPDYVAKIPFNEFGLARFPGKTYLLMGVETEKGSISDLRPRMSQYHEPLEISHPEGLVCLTGLYIDTALDGIGTDSFTSSPVCSRQLGS